MKTPLIYLIAILVVLPQLAFAWFSGGSDEIRADIRKTEEALNQIPETSLNLSPWTLGYRSEGYQDAHTTVELLITLDQPAAVDMIALLPATYTENGEELKVFCFPKRFMIERIAPDGSSEIVVNHLESDYEIFGVEPQLFRLETTTDAQVFRITVTKLSPNETWFAAPYHLGLGEVILLAGDQNVALNQSVAASSSKLYSYIWGHQALVDGFSHFSPIHRNPKNPNLVPLRISNVENVEVFFDLEDEVYIDECTLWPLVHGLQFNYPPANGLGFPLGIKIEVATKEDFNDSQIIFDKEEVYPKPGSNPFNFRLQPTTARYLKVTLSNIEFDYRTDTSELALDEIQFFGKGQLVSNGIIPDIDHKAASPNELRALTDSQTTEGTILPLRNWLIDFSRRSELERTLESLKVKLNQRSLQESQYFTLFVVCASMLIIALIMMVWIAYLLSKQHWNAVRDRIASDIHDDLGANLISVAHSIELAELADSIGSEKQQRLLKRAKTTAYQSAEDTRNIVRLLETNQSGSTWTHDLRNVITNLLGDFPHTLSLEDARSFNKLNKERAWDLLLFIKEALNNAVKHSDATHIEIKLEKQSSKRVVTIIDNGNGLIEDELPSHLESRAKRLKGALTVKAEEGKGTRITLVL
ncbi:MAG: sensor histidine kinase [Opitutaceae bacterium]